MCIKKYKSPTNKRSNQKGFALIDVLVATIILAFGIVGFMKLQNSSMRRANDINYRMQATATVNSVIDILRSNKSMVKHIVDDGGSVLSVDYQAAFTAGNVKRKCTWIVVPPVVQKEPSKKADWCAHDSADIKLDLLNDIKETLSVNFNNLPNKAVVCLNVEDIDQATMKVRVTLLWKRAAQGAYANATADDCPENMTSTPADYLGAISLQSDKGAYDVFTRI